MSRTKRILCSIGVLAAALILLIPFGHTLRLSFMEYTPVRGMTGSAWVGFKNYSQILSSQYFMRILLNSVTIGAMGTLIGAVYVFVAALAVGSVNKPIAKGLSAILFAIPAMVPVQFCISALPTELLMQPSALLRAAVSAVDGLRLAGLVAASAFFIKSNALREGVKCMLLFVAIRLMSVFSADLSVILSAYNPLTYEILDVFSSYIYRQGLISAGFSQTAAMHIIKTLLQLAPATIGVIILVVINKKQPRDAGDEDKFVPLTVAGVIPLGILAAAVISGGSLLPDMLHPTVINGYISSFVIAFFSAALVSVASVLLAKAVQNSGCVGIAALALVCLAGGNIVTNYMLIRSINLFNTVPGVILNNLGMIAVMSLIISFAIRNNSNARQAVATGIVCFVLMFAWFWGDYLSPMVMLTNRDVFPLQLVLRQIAIQPAQEAGKGIFMSTLPYILVPLIISVIGFTASAFMGEKECAYREAEDGQVM